MFSRSLIPSHLLPSPAVTPSPPLAASATFPQPPSPPRSQDDLTAGDDEAASGDPRHMEPAPLASIAEDGAQTQQQQGTSRALLADAFFPMRVSTSPNTNHSKRLSLPTSLPSKAQSSPPRPSVRKSLSPSHALARQHPSKRLSSSNPHASVLAFPLAGQLNALKDRNASLEASLEALRTAKDAALFCAKERIRTLEQEGERGKLERLEAEVRRLEEEVAERVIECEGWEAEANRLGKDVEDALEEGLRRGREERSGEVERARAEVEAQKKKRKAGKLLIERLRLEMDARRSKEKWDLAVMDAMDRKNEAATVGLEYDLAMAAHRSEMDGIEIEELEEVVAELQTKVSALNAARTLLLNSVNAAESSLSKLRVELDASRKETKIVRKDLAQSEAAQVEAQKAATQLRERIGELEGEVEQLQSELARLEKGEKKSEAKEAKDVADARKALEKEKAARAKAEADAKEAKATLKETQTSLRDAIKALATATKEAETASNAAEAAKSTLAAAKATAKAAKKTPAPLPSVKVLAARKRRSLTTDGSDPVDNLDEPEAAQEVEPPPTIEEEEEEEESGDVPDEVEEEKEEVQPVKVARKAPAARTRAPPPRAVSVPAADVEADFQDPSSPISVSPTEDLYRSPKPSKSGAKPAAKAPLPARTPPIAASKKRKADDLAKATVLADKSTNKRAKKENPAAPAAKKKRDATAPEEDAEPEGDGGEEEEAKEKPAKKKKRILFGGATKYDWGAIENAEINELGLPTDLSPVKMAAYKTSAMGILGKGLSGRPSIF